MNVKISFKCKLEVIENISYYISVVCLTVFTTSHFERKTSRKSYTYENLRLTEN